MLRTHDLVKLCLIAAIIISAAVLAGCGGGGGGAATTISGRVVDDGSQANIPNAHVVLANGQDTYADANGVFSLPSPSASATTLMVAAVNYVTQTVTVPSGTGDRELGSVYLVPAHVPGMGNVTGLVSVGGTPAAAAIIHCAGQESISKSDGTYTLYNVTPGFQTVLGVTADGSRGGSINVTVLADSTVTANLALTNQPPPPPIP